MTYDDLLAMTGGCVLATSPACGWDRAGGEWDYVREHLDARTVRRLVACGMGGREWSAASSSATDRERLTVGRVPVSPDALAAEILAHTGREFSAWEAAEWFVGAVLAVQAERKAPERVEPEPDELPAWVAAWLERMTYGPKRDYALSAARAIYWRWPEPQSSGADWEQKVWAKLGRRYAAQLDRGEVVA